MSDFDARARALFLELCDQSDAEQTQALSDTDPALAEAVGQMLAADRAAALTESRLAVGVGRRLIAESLARTTIPGQVGPYRVVEIIGEGGMGVVLRAEQDHPRRTVALKLPLLHRSSPAHLEQFRAEAQALAELRHPAVPTIYEAGVEADQAFLAMEYVSGEPLHIAAATLPLQARVQLLVQLADGVAHAHARGVVHRDLKPSNVLVDREGAVHVVDFGLAVTRDAAGHAGGTPRYMAPELSNAAGLTDPRVDVYALGYVIWEIVMGRPASDDAPLRLPADAGDLAWIVRQATQANPTTRYAHAGEVAAELRRWLNNRPVHASPRRFGHRLRLWRRRHRRLVGVMAALIVLGATSWGISTWVARRRAIVIETTAARRLANLQRRVNALRADGQHDAADAAFNAFVTLPEHAGTRAVTTAWLQRAETAANGSVVAVQALARAFAMSDDATARRSALVGLARAFHARWAWPSLAATLEHLRGAGLDADLRALARDAALIRMDLQRARALEDDPAWTRIFERLQRASASPHRAYSVRPAPDGSVVLFDQHAGRMVVAEGSAGLPIRAERNIPKPWFTRYGLPAARFGAQPTVVGWHDGQLDVFALDLHTAALTPLTQQPLSEPHTSTWRRCGDQWTLVVGTGRPDRQLWNLKAPDWHLQPTHPPSVRLASDVKIVSAVDLDADGCEELLVGRGAWSAYEIAVYRQRGPDAPLIDVGGQRLGNIEGLAVLPAGRIVATNSHHLVSALAWADVRDVPPIGVHILRWDRGQMRREAHLVPLPDAPAALSWKVESLHVGDLDRDGRKDLIVEILTPSAGRCMWLLRQTLDGRFDGRILGGIDPLTVTDLDADGASEIIVRAVEDDRTWVLGLGAGTFPVEPMPAAQIDVSPQDETGEPALDRAVARVQQLAALGLSTEAAEQLRALAEIASTPTVRSALLARSAALVGASGRHAAALAQYEALRAEGVASDAVLTGTLASQIALHRFPDALATARALGDSQTEALEKLVRDTDRVDVRLTAPLPGWQVDAPHLVRTGAALRIDAFSRRRVIMQRPVTLRSPAVALEFAVDFDRVEHAAGLGVQLREPGPDGRLVLGCRVFVYGGGNSFTESVTCTDARGRQYPMTRPAPAPGAHRSMTVRAAWRIDTHALLLESIVDGQRRVVRPEGTAIDDPPSTGQTLVLEVVSSGLTDWPGPTRAVARLKRLTLEGVEVRDAPPRPTQITALMADQGDPMALDDPALVASAQARQGAFVPAAQRLADAPLSETLLEVLRLHPEIAFAAPETMQPVAIERLLAAWVGARRHHQLPDVESVLRAPALARLSGQTPNQRLFMRAQARYFLNARRFSRAQTIVARLARVAPEERGTALLEARAFAQQSPIRTQAAARRFVRLMGSERAARAQLARHGLVELLDR